jgi:hypothetical protein
MRSPEFRALQAKFSSGVSLKELRSIAAVIAMHARIRGPSRDANRSYGLMIIWFIAQWADVAPWLPFVELRDATGRPIDGRREAVERGLIGV